MSGELLMRNEITGWLTRETVARRLGITVSRLRQLEKAGELTPRPDFSGRARFDPAIVEKFGRAQLSERPKSGSRRAPTGAECARIFRMFEERKALRDIVVETEQPPRVVLELRRQYAEMGRDLLIAPGAVEELRELLDWQGEGDKSLVAAVHKRLRYQFDRGREANGEADGRNHKESEESSGS